MAQQDAERSKFIVMKAEQEKQANIIRAEGEAEARGSPRSLSQRAPMPCDTPLVPPSDCALCRPPTLSPTPNPPCLVAPSLARSRSAHGRVHHAFVGRAGPDVVERCVIAVGVC